MTLARPSDNEAITPILDRETIRRKLLRMAYEIYEENAAEQELVIIGIQGRGTVIADVLSEELRKICPINILQNEILLDKDHPVEAVLKQPMNLTDKNLIIVDDVTNSGRTLFYGMEPFMKKIHKRIQTAVLIDRMHKSFPISVDYTGYLLSTTLQEHITVKIEEGVIEGAYLD